MYELSKNLNSKINFVGILSNEEVIKRLSKHKFYIHTSLYEGNPKTILEAMSVGCVVVVPNNRNILEIVENNFNGIVLGTAHPSKFLDVIEPNINGKVKIPERLKNFLNKEKKSIKMKNNFTEFSNYLLENFI